MGEQKVNPKEKAPRQFKPIIRFYTRKVEGLSMNFLIK